MTFHPWLAVQYPCTISGSALRMLASRSLTMRKRNSARARNAPASARGKARPPRARAGGAGGGGGGRAGRVAAAGGTPAARVDSGRDGRAPGGRLAAAPGVGTALRRKTSLLITRAEGEPRCPG